tara:strand:+ start:365 stop:598 length:234 start_codon:yes stop_codon:yes gene_type:complete
MKKDYSYVEAQVTEGKKYYDEQGWEISAPISDRECIYRSLENCQDLAGLDKKQVLRLMEEFEVERSVELIQSEYPPL